MRETGPTRKDLTGDSETAAAQLSAARTQLGILKNQMRMGNLTVGARTITLPDGTVIRVTSTLGQDRVAIDTPSSSSSAPPNPLQPRVPEPTVPPVPPGLDKYLLVVYNNNQVAAIPMSTISGASWAAVYKATLKNGSLDFLAPTAQYNFGVTGADSIFLAPFSLENHPLAQDSSKQWLNVVQPNNGTDPDSVLATQTPNDIESAPHLNASNGQIYTSDGEYTLTRGRPVLVASHAGDFDPAFLSGIGTDGTYYLGATSQRTDLVVTVLDFAELSISVGGISPALITTLQTFPTVAGTAYQTFRGGLNPPVSHLNTFESGGGANTTFDGTAATTIDPDYSLTVPLLTYEGTGKDRVDASGLNIAGSWFYHNIEVVGPTTTGTSMLNASGAVGPFTNAASWSFTIGDTDAITSQSGYKTMAYAPFPPSLSVTQAYATVVTVDGVSQIATPYFTAPGEDFQALLHLSNGQHVMQGFSYIDGGDAFIQNLYLDGVEVSDRLLAAISTSTDGVALGNVQAILMDIPLPLIQNLS